MKIYVKYHGLYPCRVSSTKFSNFSILFIVLLYDLDSFAFWLLHLKMLSEIRHIVSSLLTHFSTVFSVTETLNNLVCNAKTS
jgi:hypothetical protein